MCAQPITNEALSEVRNRIEHDKIEYIFLECSDFHGISRGRVLPVDRFLENSEDGFSIPAMQLIRLPKGDIPPMSDLPLSEEFSDFIFFPDLSTFKVIPWRKGVASVLVDPYTVSGEPVGLFTRHVARHQIERLKDYGFSILSALEYEFSLLDSKTLSPIHSDITGHWIKNFFDDWDHLTSIHKNLSRMDLIVEQIDTEGEEGVYEFPIKPSLGLKAGDDAYWLKKTVRELSQQKGYLASFSSKPFIHSSGVSGHFNHSLLDLEGKKRLFYDAENPHKMSKIMQHWLAGLIRHAPAMLIFGCPTASCQRRFACPDRATPQYPDWGIDNRTCSFRVKNLTQEKTYIENRIFASACNPYLTLAVNIAAGLDGILNELPLQRMVKGNAHSVVNILPGAHKFSGKLSDALWELEQDEVLRQALGEDFIRPYINAKKHECDRETEAYMKGDASFYDREYLAYL